MNGSAARSRKGGRRVAGQVKRRAKRTNREVRHAAQNPWLQRAARLGYVVRGGLYATMGVLALSLAVGSPTQTRDQRDTIYMLAGNPVAGIVLILVIIALTAYALWGFIRAVYDPLGRGDNVVGIVARLGFAWSGLNYAALVVFAIGFLIGTTRGGGRDSMQQTVELVMSHPAGWILVTIAGVIGIGGGLGQFIDAFKATFRKDIKRNLMNQPQRTATDALGRFGMFSRGVIFTMLGAFVLQAGLHHDQSRAHGIGAAFAILALQPTGHMILAMVAAGFVALGIHSWANGLWVRMPRTRP